MNKTLLALALAAAWGPVQAAAVTDGSMGAVQSLSGNFTVPQSLGQLKGNNLFHSFGSFSIGASESATFLSGATVQNVIARVTGSEASLLQGLLALKSAGGAKPDFFLVNPNGVTVTGGARFDVPAGLHLSTAPQMRFADGTVWATGSTAPSTLSVAAPQSFGFLGGEAALRWRGANLQLANGSTLELAGGSIAVDNALLVAPNGVVKLQSPGTIALTNGALLGASAATATGAGRVEVDAHDLTITGTDGLRTGLASQTGSAAQGGGITVRLGGALTMGQGAEISNLGASSTANGPTTIHAASASLSADGQFTSIFAQGFGTAAGPAIDLRLSGALDNRGADISTAASGSGPAGAITVDAASIRLDGLGAGGLGGINSVGVSGAPGAITVTTQGLLEVLGEARIGSNNRSSSDAGAISVVARQAVFDGQGQTASVSSINSGAGRGADVFVGVGEQLSLLRGGQINAGTLGPAAGGDVVVLADRIDMQGNNANGFVTGIYASSLARLAGPGGAVQVTAGRITMTGDAAVSTSTLDSTAGAGTVSISADTLSIDGQSRAGGIQSFAYGGQGDAGVIVVDVKNQLTLLNGAAIVAGTLGSGEAGAILVRAGSVLLDGAQARESYTGIGGDALGRGAGASVLVEAGRIDIREGSSISSSTFSDQDAGAVVIKADSIRIDGGGNARTATGISAASGSGGRAGSVSIEAGSVEVVNEGGISTSTIGAGRGGPLLIQADSLTLARGGSIFSVTTDRGDAGLIDLTVRGAMTLSDGGIIAASSGGAGAAGRVAIQAGSLTVTGSDADTGQRSRIASRALEGSGGDAGSITIRVDGAFVMGPDSTISIANDARVPDGAVFSPSFVRVQAGSIRLTGADINASASLNADAGAIGLQSAAEVRLTDSTLRTSAHNGAGGPIAISAADVVTLRNTSVTTSVDGVQGGDGGNIRIAGSALVLASGFVQANTVAAKASGGNVTIDVPLLVPDGSNVFIGGNRIAQFRADTPGFNVIQAAAPNGLAGTLDVTTPDLNLSGTLAALSTTRIDFGLLGRDVCQIGFDSSFTPLGRGALPERTADPLRLR